MFGFKSLTGQSLWLSGFSALAPVAAILSTEARPVREQRLEADRRLQWEPQWEALQAFQAGAGRLPASHPRPRVTSPSPELEQESRSVDELRSSLLLLARSVCAETRYTRCAILARLHRRQTLCSRAGRRGSSREARGLQGESVRQALE